MRDLLLHLVRPIVAHPDDIRVQVVEGEASVVLEMTVNQADREKVEGADGRTLRSLRNVLSAAAGKRKATLDLVEEFSAGAESSEE
jgi:predicted RNA-binding protein YlqC (UPF0109 family)